MTWGCYVHVPWCRAQCPYCGFYVVPGPEVPPWERFVTQVLQEYAARRPAFEGPGSTLYLGGGTPSRLPPEALARLIEGIELHPSAECSMEANPEDVEPAWLDGAIAAGIQRISLGVQSFGTEAARVLGRAHTSAQAHEACQRLAGAPLTSWSIDLIFGVPGQTLAEVDADLDATLDLGAPHVSVYGLTIEPNTPFERAQARGRILQVEDDLWRAMYDRIVDRLSNAGVERYEVSNFARPGHTSAHNRLYWSDQPYLGLGPGAHGYAPNGSRWANPRNLNHYLVHPVDLAQMEHPTANERAADLLISGMRGVEGVDRARLRERTGLDVQDAIVQILIRSRLLQPDSERLALAHDGFPIADSVIRRLLDTLIVVADGASGGPVRLG